MIANRGRAHGNEFPVVIMSEFVRDKLTEWGLLEWIQKFEEEGVDEESFYLLDDREICELIPKVGPRSTFKGRLKLLKKKQNTTNPDTADESAQVIPSTSGTSNKGEMHLISSITCCVRGRFNKLFSQKGTRRSDLQDESNQQQPLTKRPVSKGLGSYSEGIILAHVTAIMERVLQKIPHQDNNLNNFLRRKIRDLKTARREVVGVFGITGAGKSSLINAIIGFKKFLPSGGVSACTSVSIKVEANMQNSNYEAIIEFIKKEEWKDELWFSKDFQWENEEDDAEYRDIVEKLSALYEDWKEKSPTDLMHSQYFTEIPEFRRDREKILTADEATELREKMVYTRTKQADAEDTGTRRWYWPLVKCVTIKVPNTDLPEHVTLVDLPGSGDSNKSRNEMWKTVVGSCSTIWIVTDIIRAAAHKEAWEILKYACSYMGNGGQCNQIHFICTKSDNHQDAEDTSQGGIRDFIMKRNCDAKRLVMKEFDQLKDVKKHFGEGCFRVFAVSSVEFLNQKHLNQEETEIPQLQEFLQELNDCHKETLNYVSAALGILSLIQGASRRGGAQMKKDVSTILERKMEDELKKVRKQMEETFEDFEKCLSDGVDKSESSCEKVLQSGYILNGINSGPFNGKLNSFSLDTKRMKMKPEYKDVELQLEFLNAEEDKMKKKLIEMIRDRKKMIYSSLMTTVEESMQKCYDKAKVIVGTNSLKKMRETMREHVHDSKNIMFKTAQKVMLTQLRGLMEDILKYLKDTMQESIDLSLKTDGDSIPDVTEELGKVKNHHKELKGSAEEDQ
ncbi:LOW QUALITY PROTEIN: nuclear GTPase SLIP-GC-like [Spinachia spinachia]